jgi:hypothetical protein
MLQGMTAPDSKPTKTGALAELQALAGRVPDGQAGVVREIAQKECEADVKAHDALITRGNTLLAASGVAVSLLIGFSKESVVDTCVERTILVMALVAAAVAGLLVLISIRPIAARTSMENRNILGSTLTEGDKDWAAKHELSLALAYIDIRMAHAKRHKTRVECLRAAQFTYLVFLTLITAFGIAIPF